MGLSLASAPFPFVDLALGLQWLAGLFLAVLMPGYFLMGRFLHTQDPLSRFAASFASGMLIIPVVSLFLSAMRIPLFGILHTTMVILIAVVMGRSAWYQGAIKKLGKGIRPLTRWETVFILLFVLAQFTILISGLRSYCAPFHLHDASNHSFLALRVFESRSCWPSVLFTDQVGIPVIPYLTGWHTAAALSSDISSVAPYVSIWYLATFTAALFPLMMSLLWRAFGFESKTIILSTALASAIYYVPVGLFAWGGFGAMVGMGLFPWLVVVLREVVRSPSKTIAAFAGVFCISMIHIHAAELIVSLVFLLVAIPKARERTGFSGENVKGSLVTFALVILFGLLPLIPFLNAYNAVTDQSWQMTKTSFEVVWKDFWWAGSGGLTPLRYLAFFGLATGCFLPATRRVCIL